MKTIRKWVTAFKAAFAVQLDQVYTALGYCFIGALILFGPSMFWGWADHKGLIPHEHVSRITVAGNWLVGESKDCYSLPSHSNAVNAINCDKGPEHEIKVTFYGRIDQPEYVEVFWKCERSAFFLDRSDSFTCSELSGTEKLAVGTVRDGYRFLGGNPGYPDNWELVKPASSGSVPPPTTAEEYLKSIGDYTPESDPLGILK